MSSCHTIDPLVTPYVDGDIPDADRRRVDEHLRACPPCHSRVATERAVREAIDARRALLCGDKAPAALRAKCESIARRPERARDRRRAEGWKSRVLPFALAASLLLVVASAFLYQLTAGSTRVLAAELTADHMKCFAMNAVLGTHDLPTAVEGTMSSSFGWHMRLPADPASVGLELVGARPCLYGEGKIAHIMYRHDGNPVSLFMLPETARAQQLVRVLGHEAAIWCVGNRTFVLLAREPRREVERMASYVKASLH